MYAFGSVVTSVLGSFEKILGCHSLWHDELSALALLCSDTDAEYRPSADLTLSCIQELLRSSSTNVSGLESITDVEVGKIRLFPLTADCDENEYYHTVPDQDFVTSERVSTPFNCNQNEKRENHGQSHEYDADNYLKSPNKMVNVAPAECIAAEAETSGRNYNSPIDDCLSYESEKEVHGNSNSTTSIPRKFVNGDFIGSKDNTAETGVAQQKTAMEKDSSHGEIECDSVSIQEIILSNKSRRSLENHEGAQAPPQESISQESRQNVHELVFAQSSSICTLKLKLSAFKHLLDSSSMYNYLNK